MLEAARKAPVSARPGTSLIPTLTVHPSGKVTETAADVALAAAEATAEVAEAATFELVLMTMVRQSGPPQIDPSEAPGQGMLHCVLVLSREAPLTNELPQ
jgi:hypothetical protein